MGAVKVPAGLEKYQAEKVENNKALVRKTIEELSCAGEEISFSGVAERTGLSRSTLYRNKALRAMVERARGTREEGMSLLEMRRCIVRLQHEVDELRKGSHLQLNFVYEEVEFRA